MKKIILLSFILLALSLPASAQNIVSIGNFAVENTAGIRVPIYLNDSVDVGGVGIKLSYDPAVLRASSFDPIDKGNFTDFYGPDNSNNASGWITINTFKIGAGLNGNLIIGYVRLQAVGSAGSSSPLDLDLLAITNPSGDDIFPRNAINGTFNISGSVLKSIVISPSSITTLTVGGTQMFTATALDQNSNPMAGIHLSWTVSNSSVGNVDSPNVITNVTGGANTTFTAMHQGTTKVNATNGSVTGIAEVIVNNAPPFLNSINVSPPSKSLFVGDNSVFTATPKDQYGNTFAATVTWSSSNNTVGTVDASGKFTASNPGTAMVNATNGSVTGTAMVTVEKTPQKTYNISGYVSENYGLGLEGVLVQNGSYQNITVNSGYYFISDLTNGSYNFSYSRTGFDTGYLEVIIDGADGINKNKTIFDTTPPAQVTGLINDTPTRTSINLSWNSTADANYYQIFRDNASIGYTSNTYWNDTGLSPDTLYQYAVKANDSYNNWGQNSSILDVKTDKPLSLSIVSSSPLIDPVSTAGISQNFEINLNKISDVRWYINGSIDQTNFSTMSASYTNSTSSPGTYNVTSVASNGSETVSRIWNWTVTPQKTYNVSGYVFDNYGLGLKEVLVQNGSYQNVTVNSGYYFISDLTNGSYNFSYSRIGFDTGYLEVIIDGADSINKNKTIFDTTPPAQVTGLINDTPAQVSINLTWNSTADANYYQIFRDNASIGYTSNTYWNDTGLSPDTLYQYAVRANDSYNNWGQNSSILDVKTDKPLSLSIVSSSPAIDPVSTAGISQNFEINLNKISDVRWYINGSIDQTNFSTMSASYTNSTASPGTYNVTSVASNGSETVSKIWNWIVTPQKTYNVSGYVSDNYGLGLEGVLVQNGSYQNITVNSGYYLISGLTNGSYNFSYSRTGFDTGYLEVIIDGADSINQNTTIFDTTPPAQVTGLINDTPTRTSINLSWNSTADANYYQIFRDNASIGYTNNTYWNDTGLSPDTLYQYAVRANDSYNNWGQNSSILSVKTDKPLSLSIISSSPAIDPVSTAGISQNFEINLNKISDVRWYINGSIDQTNFSTMSASYTNSTASPGTYNVTSVASNGSETVSKIWNWTVTPQKTYNVSGYVSDNYGLGLKEVLVQNGSYQNITVNSGYYFISGLTNGSYNFSYSRTGFNTGYLEVIIDGADSINKNKTIFDTTPPAQVTGLINDTPTRTSINLSWNSTADANYYQIFRDNASIGYTNNTYWNDTGLSPDTLYQYAVRANDSYNNWGQNSSILSVKTDKPLSLSIISSSPAIDPVSTAGISQNFEINLNKISDVRWYINGSIDQTNFSTMSANYTNSTASPGAYNVTSVASNGSETVSIIWNWTVTPQKTYNVSGYVSDNYGLGLEGVLVQNGSYQNITVNSGYYLISGLTNGSYNFSYSRTGFDTGYLEVIIDGADSINKNKTIFDTTPPAQVTGLINDTPAQVSINLTWNSTADANYYQIFRDNASIGYTNNTYWNDTGLSPDTLYQYAVRANDSYNNWGQNSSILDVKTDKPLSLSIVSSSPLIDPVSTAGTTQVFELTINKISDVRWYINGSIDQTNFSTMSASYTNSTASPGNYNVTSVASNGSETVSRIWNWTVTPQKTYNVSGYVSDNYGLGLEGVLVQNGSYQNNSVTSGYYLIPGLTNGSYNFSYSRTGFNTGYLEVIIDGADSINQNTTIFDTTPPTISAISSSSITSTSAIISWTTNETSDSQIEYGTTTSYGSLSTLDTNLVTSHSQSLSGLQASTLYHYRVKSRDAAGNLANSSDQTFTTSMGVSNSTGYWKFDENTGTIAYDSSGNNNNGTISGAARVSGKQGNALKFDGINDYVNAGNKQSLNIVDAITIEAWVNPDLITGKSRVIASKSSVYYFQINSNGRLEVYFYGTSNPGYHRMTSTIPLNTWTHVAVTYNGSKVLLYNNGTSQSFTDTGKLVSNSNRVNIGSEGSGVGRQFSGLIDEVKIYNRSLSTSEILEDAGVSDTTPPAISAVSSSNITSTSAIISWTTNEISDTQVEYGINTSYGYSSVLNTNLVTSHSANLSGLTASTLYHYRVKSRDAAGNLAISSDQTFTTQTPPGTISGTVKNISSNTAIFGATVTDGTRSATTDTNGNYTIPNVSAGIYSVTASASGYQSITQSNINVIANQTTIVNFNLSPIIDNIPPSISAISSSSITSTSAIISWTTNETSDSQIEYGTTTSYGSLSTLDTNLVTSHSQSLSGLQASTLYHYRVKSRDAAGNLANSSDQTFTTSMGVSNSTGYWKFDENTGTIAYDSSGNNNNGTISGAARVSGKQGNALKFDGINDYVNAGNKQSLNIVDAITIEAWVNPNLITGKSRVIASKSSAYYFQINSNGRLEVYFYGTSNPGYHRMTSTIPLNAWTHVAVTYNGSNVLLYKNGTSQSFTDTGKLVSNSNRVNIGSEGSGVGRQFSGLIDEVKIYNRSLSTSEILEDAGVSDTTPPAISAVSSSNITSTSAIISWTTNEISDTRVEYGINTSYGYSSVLNTNLVTSHSANLSGLSPSTLYHYRVKSRDAAGNLANSSDQTFTTQTPPGTISGTVKNISSNTAIFGATVTDGTRSATTDTNGNYTIPNVSAGIYSVTASASGYQSIIQSNINVIANQTTIVNFNLSPIIDNIPPSISAISSSSITSTSAIISWTTNETGDTQIEYGTTVDYGSSTVLDTNLITSHSQSLSGLQASTLHHYRVKSRDAAGNLAISSDQTFTTSMGVSNSTGYWKFDENTGTIAYDSSGNNNNGTISGATRVSGRPGNALNFDGVNDYVDAGNKQSLNIVDAITIEAWVNPNLIAGKSRVIASKSSVYYFQINSNGRLEVYFYGTSNPGYHQMTSTIPLNAWTHVAVTYNGSKVLLYNNGTSQSFTDTGRLVSNSDSVFIGSEEIGSDRQFSGLIDEVKIYDRALSASEILADQGG